MRSVPRFLIAIALVVSAGCASYASYSAKIKHRLADGKFEDALEEVQAARSASSRLLALYESGLILHYAQKYDESNLQLHEAEALYEDLYTKSISREAGALVTSDIILAYRGERFESAYLHYYKILNYVHLGDGEGALVECRKLNQKLKLFRDAGGTFYTDDPFLQYLTGIVYESEGELSDAWVSYRLAVEAFASLGDESGVSTPPGLRCDLLRVASRLGYEDELSESDSAEACPEALPVRDAGSVVLLLETGFAPHKIDVELVAPIFENEIVEDLDEDEFARTLAERVRRDRDVHRKVSYWLTIAFPEMVAEPTGIAQAEVVAVESPTSATRMALVSNIEAVALRRFDEKRGGMLAKTVARALAKYLAKKKVEKKRGELAGLAVNIFNVATEAADTRSWSTLPGRIYLARFDLPAGDYTLQVALRGADGGRLTTIAIPEVTVTAGALTLVNHRAF